MKSVKVIGAGLAGCEAAWQLANRNIPVTLYEMRPVKKSPAHHTDDFAELVCSNSLRSNDVYNAVGLLKEELRRMNSLVMAVADKTRIPAGSALAVDRLSFSSEITKMIKSHPLITVVHEEICDIPDDYCIIASGPLTSDCLAKAIAKETNSEHFYFYDAAAPIIDVASIDMNIAYFKSRYDKGDADYLNCPMNKEEFNTFYHELIQAECAPIKEFEKEIYFEGCMPFEVMAKRGPKTLLFGPMKPVGLHHNGNKPYAVVQLRRDNAISSLFNIVGFQTHLTWGEQKRIIRLIPGLQNAEIVRYGVMHRNSFINAPTVLKQSGQLIANEKCFIAGQLSGVEGYVESCSSGLLAGINMARVITGKEPLILSNQCMMGALSYYISHGDKTNFQPMNANFGIVHYDGTLQKQAKKEAMVQKALEIIDGISKTCD